MVRPHTGFNRRPIRLRNPQADQACAREGHFHICGGNPAANCGIDERDLRGAQVSGDVLRPLLSSAELTRYGCQG